MSFEYAPAPESRAVVSIKPKYGHFIGGKFVAGSRHFPTINPATEEVLSQIALAGKPEVDAAVKAARKAYTSTWSKMSGKERGKYLYRIARIMQERAREFAVLETLDNGKPIRESRDTDIPLAAAHFFYHAGWADKLEFAGLGTSPKPLGVAGQIIPWNFPLLMLAWKVAPALATGNTVVLKPAESTSLTALLFAEVCQQAELPAGVVNIVTGDGSTGALIVNHPGIDKIAFTGSTEVGKIIARAVAPTKKSVTLELGGKAANIVFDDAPIDETVEGIVNGIFFNQGHVCCAGSRLLLQENVAEEVLHKLKNRMEKIRVGDPMDKNTDVGAINSRNNLPRSLNLQLQVMQKAQNVGVLHVICRLRDSGLHQLSLPVSRKHIELPVKRSSAQFYLFSHLELRKKRSKRPITPHLVYLLASGARRVHAPCGHRNSYVPVLFGRTPLINLIQHLPLVVTRNRGGAAKVDVTACLHT